MGMTRSFDVMLNEYLAIDMLKETLVKRDFMLSRATIDKNHKGGNIPVPFKASSASSIKFGGLTDESDISEDDYVRGAIPAQKEVSGTMVFHERDIAEHGSKGVNEQSFLKNLLMTSEDFVENMRQAISINLLNGSHFAKLTSDATANDGNIVVDHPERFTIGQKVIVDDDDTAAITGYVKSININTYTVNLVTARGGSTVFDFSGANMEVVQNAKCYMDGAQTTYFTSLRSQLLSATAGGDATLFGQTKTLYPYLQALNFSAAGVITATNILEKLFDYYNTTRKIGKGNPTEVIMSYKHLGSIMKIIEAHKGAYKMADGVKASLYGWTSLEIVGPKGQLVITGVNEMDDDVIYMMDWKDNVKFFTNNFFDFHFDPNGSKYFTIRSTTGYKYLIDLILRGEFAVTRPSHCAAVYGISY